MIHHQALDSIRELLALAWAGPPKPITPPTHFHSSLTPTAITGFCAQKLNFLPEILPQKCKPVHSTHKIHPLINYKRYTHSCLLIEENILMGALILR